MAILQVDKIGKRFGGLQAIKDLEFNVEEGAIFGIIGPNGAGKTTLFSCLTGFHPIDDGGIFFQGRKIENISPHKIARMGLVKTFQANRLFYELPVWKNLLIGYDCCAKPFEWRSIFSLKSATAESGKSKTRIDEVLHFIDLEQERNTLAKNLPHGSQRCLGIGIALLTQPKVLLLDEPATGMNLEEKIAMVELIQKINGRGVTVILIEHDMKLVMNICENILVLNYGQKIAEGSPGEVSNNEAVIEAYLGKGGEVCSP